MESRIKRLVLMGCALAVLVAGGALLSVVYGQGRTPKEKSSAPGTAELVPLKLEERMEVYRKLLEERNHTIYGILLVLNEIKDPRQRSSQNGRVCFAVRMLGDLRAAEAAQPLLDNIDLRFPGVTTSYSPEVDEVARALAKIGKPASTGAIERLASDKSSERAPMYVRVIARVEGIELGKVMVRLAADKEKDPEKKARLQAAIALFDKASEPIP